MSAHWLEVTASVLGWVIMAFGGLVVVGFVAWWAVEAVWRAAQTWAFGARIIRLGLKAEGDRKRAERKEFLA